MDGAADLKSELTGALGQAGAWQVGFADPGHGFGHVLPEYHPLEVWPDCRSIVVFAVPSSPEMNDTYVGPLAPWKDRELPFPVPGCVLSDEYALCRLSRLVCSYVKLVCIELLEYRGHRTSLRRIQYKPAAFEAGLGVYGRSGIVIHPELGSRLALGVVMTDAVVPPDSPLTGFDPCRGCSVCIESCPAGAYDPALDYPGSWSRETCTSTRTALDSEGLYCNSCMTRCPAGSIPDAAILRTVRAVNMADVTAGPGPVRPGDPTPEDR
jgi:ferredoxin